MVLLYLYLYLYIFVFTVIDRMNAAVMKCDVTTVMRFGDVCFKNYNTGVTRISHSSSVSVMKQQSLFH
jgi:hypothetical protein